MAEINSNAGHTRQKGGVRRSKKLSTKVDLTPMVDLGFLLITFFVFTSAISKPTQMELIMPAGDIADNNLGRSAALTIIPIANNKVFYYHGDLETALIEKTYGTTTFAITNGIGDIIRQKQLSLSKNPKLKKEDLMLIIKPSPDASYEDVVNALDETLINVLHHPALVDLEPFEKETLTKLGIK